MKNNCCRPIVEGDEAQGKTEDKNKTVTAEMQLRGLLRGMVES